MRLGTRYVSRLSVRDSRLNQSVRLRQRAAEMLLLGRNVSAAEARDRFGL